MMSRLQSACLAACATALLLTASPAFAGGCVTFSNLEHCPLGDASLTASDAGVQVSGVGSDGNDGVAVTLPDSRHWEAAVQLSDGDSLPRVTLGAESGGEEISRSELVATDDGARLSATFTGSDGPGTYSILVYRGGTLVGSQGGVQPERWITFYDDEDLFMWLLSLPTSTFQSRPNGACVWTFAFSEARRLALPDGVELEGDEIHLVEEVGDGGHYPYVAFDGITLRSSRGIHIVVEEPGV